MSIPIALPSDTSIKLLPSLSRQPHKSGESSTPIPHAKLVLSHLPPLSVRIALPADYPLHAAAKVVSLRAVLEDERSSWLPRSTLQAVQTKLSVMWAQEAQAGGEGSGVLWRWWDWISTGEFLVDIGMLTGDLRYV
jgi:E3 ubiquitin-protein ligase RNF14